MLVDSGQKCYTLHGLCNYTFKSKRFKIARVKRTFGGYHEHEGNLCQKKYQKI